MELLLRSELAKAPIGWNMKRRGGLCHFVSMRTRLSALIEHVGG